jgi:hypothetical protein
MTTTGSSSHWQRRPDSLWATTLTTRPGGRLMRASRHLMDSGLSMSFTKYYHIIMTLSVVDVMTSVTLTQGI